MNSMNRIILPSSLLSNLYKDVLVAEKTQKPTKALTGPDSVKVVVIANQDGVTLPDALLNFLQNVLKACKIDMAETAVLTKTSPLLSGGVASLQQAYQSPVILLFGLNPTILALPVHFPAFQVQAYNDCQYMWAPGLDEIAADKSLKATLWQALQKIFKL
jgi:DNA polymerase III psi subunit